MGKEETVDTSKTVEALKKEKVEEPKFSKLTGIDLKKETEMDKIENKKENKTKSDKNKDKEKGNKKVGYWVGGIVLLLIVLAIVTALILLPETPEKTVDGMLNTLKNANFESIDKYVDYDQIVNESEMLKNSTMDQETQSLLFDKLSWKVLNTSKQDETASVEVEITNKDFAKIISNYTQEALKIAFSGQSFTQEEQNNKLKEQLKNEQIGTKTITTTVELTKQDGKWKVQPDESLVNALLPGLQEAINSLNSIING